MLFGWLARLSKLLINKQWRGIMGVKWKLPASGVEAEKNTNDALRDEMPFAVSTLSSSVCK